MIYLPGFFQFGVNTLSFARLTNVIWIARLQNKDKFKGKKPKILHVRTFTQYTTCTCIDTLLALYQHFTCIHVSICTVHVHIYWHFTRKHVSTCTLNVHVHISTLYMYIYRHFTCIHVSTCTLHVSCTLYMYMFTID